MAILERVERFVAIDDIDVRTEGGQRIVDAYAALFGVRQEITDRHGHYMEELAPGSFARTLDQRSGRLQVMFNHGMTMHGTPAERFSMPYGTPLEVREDQRGLWTSVKVANTPLGDEVLELVESGAVRGQSFGGAFVKSENAGTDKRSGLKHVVRTEIALREFGLTPFPAYDTGLVSSRADLDALSVEELEELIRSHPNADDLVERLAAADPGTSEAEGNAPDTGTCASQQLNRGARAKQLRRLALEAHTS